MSKGETIVTTAAGILTSILQSGKIKINSADEALNLFDKISEKVKRQMQEAEKELNQRD